MLFKIQIAYVKNALAIRVLYSLNEKIVFVKYDIKVSNNEVGSPQEAFISLLRFFIKISTSVFDFLQFFVNWNC